MQSQKQNGITVLVTGGTGFIGAYIIQELITKGYSVKALHRKNNFPFYISKETLSKVEWIQGDILDVVTLENAMENVDAIIHSAAIVSFDKKLREQMYRINVEGTANVVNLALEKNIKRLIHISSVAAIGRTAKGQTVDEEKKWVTSSLNTHYAISKQKSEMEVWRAMAEGLSAVIVNPSTVLGFGNWNSSSTAIFKNIYHGFSWYSEGENGFVDVKDVAEVAVALIDAEIAGQRFILNGDNWPFRKLFNSIADQFKKPQPHRLATPFLGEIAWRLEHLKSYFSGHRPLLTKESAKVAHSRTNFDNSKILKALPGFNFTPLQQTIEIACGQYEQAIKNGDLS